MRSRVKSPPSTLYGETEIALNRLVLSDQTPLAPALPPTAVLRLELRLNSGMSYSDYNSRGFARELKPF